MLRTFLWSTLFAVSAWVHAQVLTASASCPSVPQAVVCHTTDRTRIEQLLADARLQTPLDFARKFKGKPYVAHTLEGNEREQLVVNTSELDCATLVETVSALAMTRTQGKRSFLDFADNLRKLRYFNGRIDGYTSRLHYLSFWIAEQTKQQRVQEVALPPRLTTPLNIRLNYMSTYPDSYEHLVGQPERVARIAQLERQHSGAAGRYLPKQQTNRSRTDLGAIRDGDILLIVTSKAGLDYSHQGIAYWGKDGHLRMLHASSERGRVIEDERTLYQYLAGIKHARGIRVFRLR